MMLTARGSAILLAPSMTELDRVMVVSFVAAQWGLSRRRCRLRIQWRQNRQSSSSHYV